MKITKKALRMPGHQKVNEMRKITKKLEQPNIIVGIFDTPKYASTYIDYSCNVRGPKCTEEPIPEDEYWKSGWKDANDFGNRYSDSWDFHICPDCQETNCMKCFDGVINKDNGQCSNKNCENHTHCKECGEEFFKHLYGDDYCINPDCENSGSDTTPKLATRNYWIQCDGPDCESDGWNPEYDRMPEGWHRDEHDRSGDNSTDYCKDCWENSICHECKEPYTDEEAKFDYHQVCKNPSCDIFNKCKHCEGDINESGNCNSPENGYGDCWTCRHCNHELTGQGFCLNNACEAAGNPYDDYFKPSIEKKSHYDHRDMHPNDFGYDPDGDENYHLLQVCDGCGLEDNTENVISRTKWHYPENGGWIENHTFNGLTMHHLVQNHLCDDCWLSGDYCDDCGEKLGANNTCENYEHCPSSLICPECHESHGADRNYCVNPECSEYQNPYDDIYKDKK